MCSCVDDVHSHGLYALVFNATHGLLNMPRCTTHCVSNEIMDQINFKNESINKVKFYWA